MATLFSVNFIFHTHAPFFMVSAAQKVYDFMRRFMRMCTDESCTKTPETFRDKIIMTNHMCGIL